MLGKWQGAKFSEGSMPLLTKPTGMKRGGGEEPKMGLGFLSWMMTWWYHQKSKVSKRNNLKGNLQKLRCLWNLQLETHSSEK